MDNLLDTPLQDLFRSCSLQIWKAENESFLNFLDDYLFVGTLGYHRANFIQLLLTKIFIASCI